MQNEVLVPLEFDPDAGPNRCFLNVEERVARDGGEAVLGWAVCTECEGVVDVYYHHAVWRKPTGELVEITPKIWWDGTVYDEPTRFVPDPAAQPTGTAPNRSALPPRYVPLVDDPDVRQAAAYFEISEAAYYAGDMARCAYYTGRSERCINRYLKRVGKPLLRFGLPAVGVTRF